MIKRMQILTMNIPNFLNKKKNLQNMSVSWKNLRLLLKRVKINKVLAMLKYENYIFKCTCLFILNFKLYYLIVSFTLLSLKE